MFWTLSGRWYARWCLCSRICTRIWCRKQLRYSSCASASCLAESIGRFDPKIASELSSKQKLNVLLVVGYTPTSKEESEHKYVCLYQTDVVRCSGRTLCRRRFQHRKALEFVGWLLLKQPRSVASLLLSCQTTPGTVNTPTLVLFIRNGSRSTNEASVPVALHLDHGDGFRLLPSSTQVTLRHDWRIHAF